MAAVWARSGRRVAIIASALCARRYLHELLAQAAPTATQMRVFRCYLLARAALLNACVLAYNCTVGLFAPSLRYTSTRLPPNGPALMEALYAAHGFQIFEAGAFNADPHAGNVLLDEASEVRCCCARGRQVAGQRPSFGRKPPWRGGGTAGV